MKRMIKCSVESQDYETVDDLIREFADEVEGFMTEADRDNVWIHWDHMSTYSFVLTIEGTARTLTIPYEDLQTLNEIADGYQPGAKFKRASRNKYACDIDIDPRMWPAHFGYVQSASSITASSSSWYNKYHDVVDKYMPNYGEGETRASQTVTAMNRIVYKWYNDGDVFDNHWKYENYDGWANDLSPEGNWLYSFGPRQLAYIMPDVNLCESEEDYEDILKMMCDICFDEDELKNLDELAKEDSIYTFSGGPFSCEYEDEDEDEDW